MTNAFSQLVTIKTYTELCNYFNPINDYINAIKNHSDIIDWFIICANNYDPPTIEFIRTFKDVVSWRGIRWNRTLCTEDFVREFADVLEQHYALSNVIHRGNFSKEFLVELVMKGYNIPIID